MHVLSGESNTGIAVLCIMYQRGIMLDSFFEEIGLRTYEEHLCETLTAQMKENCDAQIFVIEAFDMQVEQRQKLDGETKGG